MKKLLPPLALLIVLATNAQNVGIGTNAPSYKLDVVGDVNVNTGNGYRVNGSAGNGQYLRGDGTKFTPNTIQPTDVPSGSGFYIWNGTTLQTGDFRLSGNGSVGTLGIGIATPNASAILDIIAGNKGVSFPNVDLQSNTDATTIALPKRGLLVYNTGVTLSPSGLYVNMGIASSPNWLKLSDASGTVGSVGAVTPLQNTGTASNVVIELTGTVPITKGGTGLGLGGVANGQLLIGNGTGFTTNTIASTTNQTTVTNGAGSILVGTVQDIATSSNVTFNRVSATGANINSVDATGSIKPGTTNATAPTAGAGAIRTNGTNLEYSDGTIWKTLSSGGTLTGVTASNGLTATPSGSTVDVTLGGTLNAPTTIATAGNNIYVTGTGNLGVGDNTAPARLYLKGDGTNPILAAVDNTNVVKVYVDPTGRVGVNTNNPGVSLDVRTTDAVKMPSGTTAQRPVSPLAGTTRFNTDNSSLEYFDGTQWVSSNTTQVPIATIAPYAGATAPSGWLICDGTAVSRTTFSLLFAVVGTSYGAGDGSTTFNLPDLRGRAAFGLSASAPYNTLGAIGGAISATPSLSTSLTAAYPTFTATLPNHTHTLPAHFHGFGAGSGLTSSTGFNTGGGTNHSHTVDPLSFNTTDGAGGHNHSRGTNGVVGNGSYGLLQRSSGTSNTVASTDVSVGEPNIVSAPVDLGLATDGGHNHSIDVPNTTSSSESAHTHSIPALTISTGNIGLVTGGVDGNSAMTSGTGSNPAITITAGGSSTAVSGTVTGTVSTANPFQVTNYIIKATNTATASIVAVNIPTGTLGQTLYNNGSAWTPTSNLYNNGTNVGVGTTSPASALSVGSGNPFQVTSAGAIAAATSITSSGTITLSGLNTNGLVRTTGTNGILSIGQAATADIANLAITDAKINDVAWGKITSKPTTIAGYGITDAAPISGSSNYIQNQFTGAQTTSELWLSGRGRFGNGTTIYGDRLEVNENGAGNRFAYVDFTGDATYTDFGLRLLRDNTGANAASELRQRGTGALSFITNEAAPLLFSTTNAERMRIDATGNVGIGTNNPGVALDVNGTALNKNPGCVIVGNTWTANAIGSNYASGTYFVPTSYTSSGTYAATRLINQGTPFNTTTGNTTTTGLFTASQTGFHIVTLQMIGVLANSRLLICASLNGALPSEIFDQLTSAPCGGATSCADINYSMVVYLNSGDTYRLLRHSASVAVGDMIIAMRLM